MGWKGGVALGPGTGLDPWQVLWEGTSWTGDGL